MWPTALVGFLAVGLLLSGCASGTSDVEYDTKACKEIVTLASKAGEVDFAEELGKIGAKTPTPFGTQISNKAGQIADGTAVGSDSTQPGSIGDTCANLGVRLPFTD